MRSITILGGTGPEGRGLALRFALSGLDVVLGSRVRERAERAAAEVAQRLAGSPASGRIVGVANAEAARRSSLVCPVVPFQALPSLLAEVESELSGKVILDVANPIIRVGGQLAIEPLEAGSASEWIQQLVPQARVVGALKNLSAEELLADHPLHGDALVCGDDPQARATILELIAGLKDLRGIDAGPLRNARFLESVTALLLNLNRRHQAVTSIRILGL